MQIGGAVGAVAGGLAVAGCAVVAPLVDQRMENAPRADCVAIAAPPADGAGQCFVLLEEQGAERRAWSGGALRPGRTLVAIHQPGAAGCGGRFSHLTVTGASEGGGRAELSTWDPIGRPGHARTVRWDRPYGRRTFALASIDNVTMLPAGARIRVLQGSFAPANLCLKSY